jgi:hypothetical protein
MFIPNTTVNILSLQYSRIRYEHIVSPLQSTELGMNILSPTYSRIRYEHRDNMFIPNTTVMERHYVHT